ncbi:hypothetical protein BJV82DRAFT_676661 [Fennellomyces sp. T-0311]|nr:hypothetical protein BJV82DRAFT_676661 [Fennellomyces sp. T-0311]
MADALVTLFSAQGLPMRYSEANRWHYERHCALLAPMFAQLRDSFQGAVGENQSLIDTILNALSHRAHGLRQGHWRTTWPLLLHTLRDIDICSHPDVEFEPEPDPRQALDRYLDPPAPSG